MLSDTASPLLVLPDDVFVLFGKEMMKLLHSLFSGIIQFCPSKVHNPRYLPMTATRHPANPGMSALGAVWFE